MHAADLIAILILQLIVILLTSRLVGWLFRFLDQPQVMGEMVAGIMLGPSVFKLIWPHAWAVIFPAATIVYLNVLSQIGVVFFLFLIGLELDPKLLRNRGRSAVIISQTSILCPFLLGIGLTFYLYPRVLTHDPPIRFLPAALFIGAAMSITAFPVLARILTERNMHKTPLGAIAITCAAVDDVTAWCILAFVIGVARSAGLKPGLITAALALVYVAVMFFGVRPFLRRIQAIHERQGKLSQGIFALVLLLTLVSAYCTQRIGIHALFGAFFMGAMMPKGSKFVAALTEKLEDFVVVFLLPVFFAYTGLQTQIGLLNSGALWIDTGLIIFVACLGKFGGSAIAGKACGLSWLDASAIGILMNTRGLMELVILNIGLQEGVITPAVFAMMVLMALVTTALTTPVLRWIWPTRLPGLGQTPTTAQGYRILVPVSRPESGPGLARLAHSLIGATPDSGSLIALYLRPPGEHNALRFDQDEPEVGLNRLTPLLAQATKLNLPVESVSFISSDVPEDINAVASARKANLILMGFHQPVFTRTVLGGMVRRVLDESGCDVLIFIDRPPKEPKRIVLPIRGSEHDRLALDLVGRMRQTRPVDLLILMVVDPDAPAAAGDQSLTMVNEKLSKGPGVTVEMITDASPIDIVLAKTTSDDLLVLGLSETWGLGPRRIGLRPERIVQDFAGSILIVRHGD